MLEQSQGHSPYVSEVQATTHCTVRVCCQLQSSTSSSNLDRTAEKLHQFLFQINDTDDLHVDGDVPIDEYSMMSHCLGNAKLEYNGVFRAQLCMITGSRSVK